MRMKQVAAMAFYAAGLAWLINRKARRRTHGGRGWGPTRASDPREARARAETADNAMGRQNTA